MKKLTNLETIPNEFYDQVQSLEKELADEIISLLSELEIVGGKIAVTESNLAKVDSIMSKLNDSMFDKDYGKALQGLMKGFDEQANLNNKLFGKLFDNFSDKSIFERVLEDAKMNTLRHLDATQVTSVYSPIRDLLTQAIIGNAGLGETIKAITFQLEENGLLTRYVKTIVRDAFAMSDRAYTKIISDQLGVVFFEYSGGVLEDSREFCLERLNQIWHIDEIKSWANEEWQGKNQDTTEFNIFDLLGGYNCIHSLLPVASENVPDSVLKRVGM